MHPILQQHQPAILPFTQLSDFAQQRALAAIKKHFNLADDLDTTRVTQNILFAGIRFYRNGTPVLNNFSEK